MRHHDNGGPFWTGEVEVARRLLDALAPIAGPLSLVLWRIIYVTQDWRKLTDLEANPHYFAEPRHFAAAYLLGEILKKSPENPAYTDRERTEAAQRSFWTAERRCGETNKRLLSEHLVGYDGDRIPTWFPRARDLISGIVGDLRRKRTARNPVRPLERISQLFRHGPGSTTDLPFSCAYRASKYEGTASCTPRMVPFLDSIMGPHWRKACEVKIRESSKWMCVPKSAKTHRGIDVQPGLNLYGQLGIGSYLKERLRLFGIDLKNGWMTNNDMARQGVSRGLATIDMKQASDMLASSVVLLLFPRDWFELLWLFRVDFTLVNNKVVELEKFSAMGNGFTFELESIVFLAVARAIVPRSEWDDVSIFGDDLIIPIQYVEEVICALNYLGFDVNTEKSHWHGNFRESCGGHFLDGRDVTPFRFSGQGSSDTNLAPFSLRTANALRAWMERTGVVNPELVELWIDLVRSIPSPWNKTFGPPILGDTCIHRGYDEVTFRSAFHELNPHGSKRGSGHVDEFSSACQHEGIVARVVSITPKDLWSSPEELWRGPLLSALHDKELASEPIARLCASWGVVRNYSRFPDILEMSSTDYGPAFPTARSGFEPARGIPGRLTRSIAIVQKSDFVMGYGGFSLPGRIK